MSWLTWRQHRTELFIALPLLGLAMLGLSLTQRILMDAYAQSGAGAVQSLLDALRMPLFIPISLLPLLLGMFVGAPLVAGELEAGTNRLVWTQGIPRERWLSSKLWLLGGTAAGMFGILSGVLLHWNRVVNETVGPWKTFDTNGVVLVAYALFGLTLGVALGAALGRTVPAMALVILIFLLARGSIQALRPYYLPPQTLNWEFGTGENPIDSLGKDWIISSALQDKNGKGVLYSELPWLCSPSIDFPNSLEEEIERQNSVIACYREHGLSTKITFQPAERFWIFQGIESGIFLTLSAALYWFSQRRLRHHL